MATFARGWSPSRVTIGMATGTDNRCMGAGQRESCCGIVIKCSRCPRRSSMTKGTVRGVFCSHMRRRCRGIVFIDMTAHTIGRGTGITGGVAADAAYTDVASGERESCGSVMVEIIWYPGCCSVTYFTVGWKFCRYMIWVCGGIEFG